MPTGGTETALTTPSGQQSGLKMNVDIDVAADKVADVVLDFDACKSVVKRGNSGQYNLKPVIAVIPVVSDAGLRVSATSTRRSHSPTTQVSVQAARRAGQGDRARCDRQVRALPGAGRHLRPRRDVERAASPR